MKKLVVLVVLALTLIASMAGAASWTSTSYLTAPNWGQTTGEYFAVKLDVIVELDDIVPGQWNYVYTLTNDAGSSNLFDFENPIYKFNITLPSNLVNSDITVYDAPDGWTPKNENSAVSWTTVDTNKAIAKGTYKTFSFWSKYGPWQVADAAAIDGRSFNGNTMVPTPVPEASTMVGFGSALLMAGPGMIGWIRRRRS